VPYKDPERKHQWEREHREERNARRRTTSLPANHDRPREAATADLITEQKTRMYTFVYMIAALVAGMFVMALLFAAWRLHSKVSEPSVHAQGVPAKGQ
jgi:hypothetical protein